LCSDFDATGVEECEIEEVDRGVPVNVEVVAPVRRGAVGLEPERNKSGEAVEIVVDYPDGVGAAERLTCGEQSFDGYEGGAEVR